MATGTATDLDTRIKSYKNKGLNPEEGRKKRNEESVLLRKSKREDQFLKRRNISEPGVCDKEHFLSEVASVHTLCTCLYSESEEEVLTAILRFRKLLSSNYSPPIEETIASGCLPKFTELLTSPNSQLQFESAWIITNIASGSSLHTRALFEAGAIPPLVQLVYHSENSISDQAIWALGNIAGDGPEFRDVLLGSGVMTPILEILASDTRQKKNVTWTLSNLCRGKNPLPDAEMVMPCLPLLAQLLYHEDKEVLSNSLWAVAFLADGPNERIQKIVECGLCQRLTQFLMLSTEKTLIAPALRAVGNILTGDDVQTQVMINSSVLPALQHLLSSSQDNLKKEACWAISNITAGNRVQIQATIDCNIFPTLVGILHSGAEYKTRKEAAWAILNATSGGTHEQIRFLVSVGCIKPLCDFLIVQDSKMVVVTLEGLENILKVGNKNLVDGVNPFAGQIEEAYGLEKIEYLQVHSSDRIYRLAGRIIEKYFSDDENSHSLDTDD